jgi:hypothetical protein
MPGRRGHPGMNLPSLAFGLLISTALGLAFHLLRGGGVSRMLWYLVTAWLSFPAGHFVGGWIGIDSLRLGDINLLPAMLATILGLILASFLALPARPARPDSGNKADSD